MEAPPAPLASGPVAPTARRIGYYFSKGKASKLGWDSFVKLAGATGISVMELDLNKKLEDQPECNIYIHKLTDELTAASSGVEGANTHGEKMTMTPAQLADRLKEWQGYLSRRVAQVVDLDPVWAQRSSIDRVAFLAIIEQMNHAIPVDLAVQSPKHVLLEKEEVDYSLYLTGIRFPVLVKTVRACGAQDAHLMSVAFSEKGLHQPEIRAPIIVQEYLNHGAVIWKIFVIGDYVAVVGRPSLCDLALDPARANITFNSQKGVPVELLAAQPGSVPQPSQNVLEAMASWLSARTGMTLFGFDVVVHTNGAGRTSFGVIDINYFPGYSGVTDFNARLLSHALRALAEKEKAAAAVVSSKRALDGGGDGVDEEEGGDDEAEEKDDNEGAEKDPKARRTEKEDAKAEETEGKAIKRRVAICLSYNGAGYLGMQKNPAVKTIEGDLEKALFQTGRISAANYGSLAKVSWQRCARTDKGVSAQGQIVSLKVTLKAEDEIVKIPAELNAVLPPSIKVHVCQRVTQSFNAKNNCNSRTYNYLLPAFALLASPHAPANRNTLAEALTAFRTVMKSFSGTHSFHNFTAKVDASMGGAQRYMMHVDVQEPREFNGVAFVLVEIRGQSFMLHQIRKMIGTAIAIVRDGQSGRNYQILTGMWSPTRQMLPMAPGLGLLLVKCHYDSYNERMKRDKVQPPLEFDSAAAEMDDFKWKCLLAPIVNLELTTHSMVKWLRTLDLSTLDYNRIVQTGIDTPPRHPSKVQRKK